MCYWSPMFLQVYVYSRFVWFIQVYFEEKQISLPYRGKKSGLFFCHKWLNRKILQWLSSFKTDSLSRPKFLSISFYRTNIFTRLFWLKKKENFHLMATRVLKYSEGNSDSNSTKYFCVLIKGSSISYVRKIFRKCNVSYYLIRTLTCWYQR